LLEIGAALRRRPAIAPGGLLEIVVRELPVAVTELREIFEGQAVAVVDGPSEGPIGVTKHASGFMEQSGILPQILQEAVQLGAAHETVSLKTPYRMLQTSG
jgi:hypothetical protein